MSYFFRFTTLFAVSLVFFFLQTTEIFKVGLINPNLLLIFCVVLLIFYERKEYLTLVPLVYLGLIIYSVLFTSFWLAPVLVIITLALLASFINLRWTGTKIVDIGLVILVFTLSFYIILWVIGVQPLGFFVLGEMLYNILVAVILYPIMRLLFLNIK